MKMFYFLIVNNKKEIDFEKENSLLINGNIIQYLQEGTLYLNNLYCLTSLIWLSPKQRIDKQ
ncbi:hypothetical protein CAB17_11575 [Legionella sainthelensi]|uniref:Uncharacterized protein n=1 Tax=Legionella sainthelensi TaxID=28087 RepID=A0A2H5FM44_9GAMM|nr:hypothetical protein CAB17_11575 [Legionella sainthelensi]